MSNLYLLGGAEQFHAITKTAQLLQEFNKSTKSEVFRYFGDELSSINEIAGLSGGMGLFATRQVVVLVNFLSNAKKDLRENVSKRLEAVKDDPNTLFIFRETGNIDKRLTLYKYLNKEGQVFNYEPASIGQKLEFTRKRLAREGFGLGSEIINELSELIANYNLIKLDLELGKLVLLLRASQRQMVATSDLNILDHTADKEIWELLNLAAQSKPLAFDLLTDLLNQEVEPIQIIGFLSSQLRNLILYYYRPQKLPSFLRSRLTKLAGQIPPAKLTLLVRKLTDLDYAAKSGRVDPKLGLFLYLTLV